jgi:hypothetical protein
MCSDIKETILAYYLSIARDSNHRFRSWEHCFRHFQEAKAINSPEQEDVAALHLGFYLASWGMYRGSAALLQKDYKVHLKTITKILEPNFSLLWGMDFSDEKNDGKNAGLIVKLFNAVKETYLQQFAIVQGSEEFDATDTLISKVLLGTTGCMPACDTYFIVAFRQKGYGYSGFGESFLKRLFCFYRKNRDALTAAQKDIQAKGGICYPPMKLIDMYFWKIGSEMPPKPKPAKPGPRTA